MQSTLSETLSWLDSFGQYKIKPRVVYCLIINWIQNHWQIFRAPFFFHSVAEVFWIRSHPSRLAVLPVSRIPSCLAPVNDRCYSWIRPRRQKDVWWDKIVMCEDNRRFPIYFDSTSVLELLDSICTLEWPRKVWMTGKKDLVQWLPTQTTYKEDQWLGLLESCCQENLPT